MGAGMTTGNTVAMTVSKAKQAPAATEADCERLQERNNEQRDAAIEGMKSERERPSLTDNQKEELDKMITKAEEGGMTFSSAAISVGIGGGKRIKGVATGSSSAKAQECTSGDLVKGGSGDVKLGNEGILCGDPKYRHAPPTQGNCPGGHAEAKIFNQMNEMAGGAPLSGGRVLLNIDWRYARPSTPGEVYRSGMPCRHCFRMLCHVATQCKVEVLICDKSGKPTPLDDDVCKKEDGYDQFDQKVDHWETVEERRVGWGALTD